MRYGLLLCLSISNLIKSSSRFVRRVVTNAWRDTFCFSFGVFVLCGQYLCRMSFFTQRHCGSRVSFLLHRFNMGVASPTLISLCLAFCSAGAAEPGPAFPDGVAELLADMRNRVSSASVEHGDDSEAVAKLENEAVVDIAQDLAFDEQSSRLETTAFAMVHERVLKLAYVGGCPRDMSGCPTSWADRSDGVCEPPEDYDGLCNAVDVKGLSHEQKEDFAWKCRASWPCALSCKLNFATCPDSWDNLDGLCLAPSTYDGTCSPAMLFSSFTSQQKAAWASMCSVRWPCV